MKGMNFTGIFLATVLIATVISLSPSLAFAYLFTEQVPISNNIHEPQTEIIPLNGMIGLEKTTIFFHAPKQNTLPWGFVEGNVANHVEGYPVIIQIFSDNEPVHFAQTDVEKNGDYEYRFRVLNVNDGHVEKIFEGDYLVRIFKVVYMGHTI